VVGAGRSLEEATNLPPSRLGFEAKAPCVSSAVDKAVLVQSCYSIMYRPKSSGFQSSVTRYTNSVV
jgi:hypothetical protein